MKRVLIFAYAILFVSCEKNDLSLKGNSIDSKIAIETREVLEPSLRRVTFLCKTDKIYPCVNFSILTEKAVSESSVKITFTSVDESDLCLTALGPATVWIDAGVLSAGEYDIEFNNGSLVNRGKMIITDADIGLRFAEQRGISIVRQVTRRIPEKTYWGVIGYHDQSSATVANTFIRKFKDLGAKFDGQVPGYYSYYEIDEAGNRVFDRSKSGYWFAVPFVFQFYGDEAELKKLIQIEGNAYKNEVSISSENYKGEQLNNWTK